jgi:hypothetical protein
MPDLVVCVPDWIDLLQCRADGERWSVVLGKVERPPLHTIPGEITDGRSLLDKPATLYLCAFKLLRAMVPITALRNGIYGFVLDVDDLSKLTAVGVAEPIPEWWRGWREVTWKRESETPFPAWATRDVPPPLVARAGVLAPCIGRPPAPIVRHPVEPPWVASAPATGPLLAPEPPPWTRPAPELAIASPAPASASAANDTAPAPEPEPAVVAAAPSAQAALPAGPGGGEPLATIDTKERPHAQRSLGYPHPERPGDPSGKAMPRGDDPRDGLQEPDARRGPQRGSDHDHPELDQGRKALNDGSALPCAAPARPPASRPAARPKAPAPPSADLQVGLFGVV